MTPCRRRQRSSRRQRSNGQRSRQSLFALLRSLKFASHCCRPRAASAQFPVPGRLRVRLKSPLARNTLFPGSCRALAGMLRFAHRSDNELSGPCKGRDRKNDSAVKVKPLAVTRGRLRFVWLDEGAYIMPPMPPMPPIPPMPAAPGPAASSLLGVSATAASVVRRRPATEAAS